jgi:hypothetical protein
MFAIVPQAKAWIEEARVAFAHVEDRLWVLWGGKILFPELFAQIKADWEVAVEAVKKPAEEETRHEVDARERVEEDKQRQADEEHQLKIITLKSDALDCIDEAYEKVSKREISFEEMKAIEQRVEAELARAMQELESVEAGGKAAAGVRRDDMDLDATPAAKNNTPPARKQVAKRKRVEFMEKTGSHRCERCQQRNMECLVPEGER